MIKDLIVIKQLPQIEEHLKELSIEIDKKVENAKSLVCTEENVKTIKQVRADLNKEFKEAEKQRKIVKEQILAPYMQFDSIYTECISNKYKSADVDLKQKIDTVESELKAKKEQEIKDYFEEYKTANKIDFITYEQARINVTLTASMKSLKGQAKEFVDKIADDLKLIETQQHKAEILVEYKRTLNVSNAITTVINRFEAIEEEKKKQEEIANQYIEKEKEKLQEAIRPFEQAKKQDEFKVSNEFVITPVKREITIKVKAFNEEIERLKQFLSLSNIEYESEDI